MSSDPTRKKFAIVTAVYNVGRYLDDFISSIERQTYGLDDLEVIAVDDGSTDDSLARLREWEVRRPGLVTVLSQPNGGQGSARNLGLEHVTAEWVSFPDPDDVLAADYFNRVSEALGANPKIAMVATNRIIWKEATGKLLDWHPLRAFFAHRDQVKNLDEFPEFFHGSAPAAFMRSEIIEGAGLRFDTRIRPNFEDGHFCQMYLLACPAPVVAFLRSARYHYRKRADLSSTLQTAAQMVGHFEAVPRYGYLALLEHAAAQRGGRAPDWVQNMVLYELSYYVSAEDESWQAATACQGEVAEEFVRLLRRMRRYLDPQVIRAFAARELRSEWRQVLLYGLTEEDWSSACSVLNRYDERRKRVLVSVRFSGAEPRVEAFLKGRPVEPVATKVRDYVYFEHALLRERLIWTRADGTVRVRVDGEFVELTKSWRDNVTTSLRPAALRRQFGVSARQGRTRTGLLDRVLLPLREATTPERRLVRFAASRPVRRRFGRAWVFMDRISSCGDSGERLFDYVRQEHPETDAWFVLSDSSPDWARMRAKIGHRLVAHGSVKWKLLMLNCQHLISTHIDDAITKPPIAALRRNRPWRFVFLQEEVLKDDIANWLNRKAFTLMVTSTPAEHESIVGDHTRYRFTTEEVQRTGLPRLDRQRTLGKQRGLAGRDLMLVSPTWRRWLNLRLGQGDSRRVVDDFATTEYARNWVGLINSPGLIDACEQRGLAIAFLPHPTMQPVLGELQLPPHVRVLRHDEHDLQELLARTAVMVTDYSSLTFDAAYIDVPVLYFQFDRERTEAVERRGRKGYFDYERDGFGPVARDVDGAVSGIAGLLSNGGSVQSEYARRAAEAFPDREGSCCERTYQAINRL